MVKDYIVKHQSIDKSFIDNYIKIYDDNFPGWISELDNIMTDRYILTDNPGDFSIMDQKFPYRSMSQYEDNISESSIDKLAMAPITKIIIISKDNKNKLRLIKQYFAELKNWEPDEKTDFTYSVLLADRMYKPSFIKIIQFHKSATLPFI